VAHDQAMQLRAIGSSSQGDRRLDLRLATNGALAAGTPPLTPTPVPPPPASVTIELVGCHA
jgi:hypothetical protein